MGTRSHTLVTGGWPHQEPSTYLGIYRQFDGYPEGMGLHLAMFLNDMTIVNGLNHDRNNIANGPGCLAAQLVKHLKEGPGNVYIEPADLLGEEEFVYRVNVTYPSPSSRELYGAIRFTAWEGTMKNVPFFDGTPAEFIDRFAT